MVKELLIYGEIWSRSAADFVKAFAEVSPEDELVVRINTEGGSPEYAWGMAAKFSEFAGKKVVKVDGKAYSAGTFFAAYADEVEALDVSEFLVHRAAYPDWFEKSDMFTAELRGNLERINVSLRKALEAKIDVAAFEEMKGVKMKDIFSMDNRIDVFLNAKEAKKIGLVSKINALTPKRKAAIGERIAKIAAMYTEAKAPEMPEEVNEKTTDMTIQELKANHPAVYEAAFNAGVTAERDRVEAILVYQEVDPEAVKKAIEAGTALSAKAREEFAMKAIHAGQLKALKEENADTVETDEEKGAKNAEAEKLAAFMAEVDGHLKINKN